MLVVQRIFLAAACAAIVAPQAVLAQQPTSRANVQQPLAKVIDVSLQKGGLLWGQVVNPQGRGLDRAPVSVRLQRKEIVRAEADRQGRFAIRGLRGGVYQVASEDSFRFIRVWAEGTAPPSANSSVMLVAGQAARGQGSQPYPAPQPVVETGGHGGPSYWGPSQMGPGHVLPAHGPPGHVGPRGLTGFVSRYPLLVGTGVAAAIALPLALDDDLDLPEE